jgi:hypothetical protein
MSFDDATMAFVFLAVVAGAVVLSVALSKGQNRGRRRCAFC